MLHLLRLRDEKFPTKARLGATKRMWVPPPSQAHLLFSTLYGVIGRGSAFK